MQIAGIEVNDKVYKEFSAKMFDVPGEKPMKLRTLEIYAASEDVKEHDPDLREKCKAVLEQVRTAVLKAQRDINGLSFQPKHDKFSGYIEDLRSLHSNASAEREELRREYEKTVKHWREIETTGKTELDRSRAKTNRLEAEKKYKADLEDLQERTRAGIEKIREGFSGHLTEFYSPSGAKLDAETVSLLKSGLKLRESEIDALADKYKSNVTMLRLLGEYADEHKIKSKNIQMYYTRATSNGSHESSVFDSVADMITKAVSSNDVSSRVWGANNGHFDRLSSEAMTDLDNVVVKPE